MKPPWKRGSTGDFIAPTSLLDDEGGSVMTAGLGGAFFASTRFGLTSPELGPGLCSSEGMSPELSGASK